MTGAPLYAALFVAFVVHVVAGALGGVRGAGAAFASCFVAAFGFILWRTRAWTWGPETDVTPSLIFVAMAALAYIFHVGLAGSLAGLIYRHWRRRPKALG